MDDQLSAEGESCWDWNCLVLVLPRPLFAFSLLQDVKALCTTAPIKHARNFERMKDEYGLLET